MKWVASYWVIIACLATIHLPAAFATDHGDTPATATPIVTDGTLVDGNMEVATDNDYFSFTATVGNIYVIRTSDLGTTADTILALFDTNGTTQLATNDDFYTPDLSSRIDFTPSVTGTYYFNVYPYGAGGIGTYKASVTGRPDSDDHGNTGPTGTVLTAGNPPTNGDIEVAGDTDFFIFRAIAGAQYVLKTSNLGAGSDTLLRLFDTDGTTLLADNDDVNYPTDLTSEITWRAPAAGLYYASVTHVNPSGTGTYEMAVTEDTTPVYDASGQWTIATSNNWVNAGTGGCSADSDETVTVDVTQTGANLTVVINGQTYTGMVYGTTYSGSALYPENGGTTNVNVNFVLSSDTAGSGTVAWRWSDGAQSCNGGADISLSKGVAATYDATGTWTYTTSNNYVNPGNAGCTVEPSETLTVTVTQTGSTVDVVIRGRTYSGTVRGGNNYTGTASFPEDGGTTTTTVDFTLTSATAGTGTVGWLWTDGSTSCDGGGDITLAKGTTPPTITPGGDGGGGGGCFVNILTKN